MKHAGVHVEGVTKVLRNPRRRRVRARRVQSGHPAGDSSPSRTIGLREVDQCSCMVAGLLPATSGTITIGAQQSPGRIPILASSSRNQSFSMAKGVGKKSCFKAK